MDNLDRIDPETGKKRRGRPPKPRPDGTVPPPKRKRLDEFGNPLPKGTNPVDPITGKKKRGRPKKSDMLPGSSGGGMMMSGGGSGSMMSGPASEGGSSTSGGGGGSNAAVGLPNEGMMKHEYPPSRNDGEDGGCSDSDAPSSLAKTPTRLPPFSPNFRGGMGSLTGDDDCPGGGGNEPTDAQNDDRLRPSLDGNGVEDGSNKDLHQPGHHNQHDHHHLPDLSSRLRDGDGGLPPHSPQQGSAGRGMSVGHQQHDYDHHQPRGSLPGDHMHEEASHHSGSDHLDLQHQQRPDSARSLNHPGAQSQHPQQSSGPGCNFSNPTTPVDDINNGGGYPQGYPTPPGNGSGGYPQTMKNEPGHHQQQHQHQESPTYQHSFHAPYRTMQDTPPHQGSSGFDSPQHQNHGSGGRQLKHADPGDVSSKSLTGLESLVDQIPAIAENDSGVFSGSGGGSHPPTPRSVGPYSPGQFHGNGATSQPGYLNSGFSGAGYPAGGGGGTPGPSSSTDNYPTDLSSTSTNYNSGAGGASSAPTSHSPVTHSNFSVSSLVHSSRGGSSLDSSIDSATAAAAAALAAGVGGGHSSLSDAFSVSSLASSYASALTSEAELSKYAASSNHPYMSQSSMFSSSLMASRAGISPAHAATNFMSAASGMGGMASMGMASMAGMYGMSSAAVAANYGQYGSAAAVGGAYSNSAQAAAQAFAAAASGAGAGAYPHHGLHMPNPSYPYPSTYPHAPYSQYF